MSGGVQYWFSGKDEWFALYADDSNIDDETFCQSVKRGQFRLHPKVGAEISKGCITVNSRSDFQVIRRFILMQEKFDIPKTNLKAYGMVSVGAAVKRTGPFGAYTDVCFPRGGGACMPL